MGSHPWVTPPLPEPGLSPGTTAQRGQRTAGTGAVGGNYSSGEAISACVPGEEGPGSKPPGQGAGAAHKALPEGPKWRLARRRRRLVATRPAGPSSPRELQLPDIPLWKDYNSRQVPRAGGGRPALHIPAAAGNSGQLLLLILRGARPAVSGGSGAVTFPAGPPPEPLPERGPGWQRWEVSAGRQGSARCQRGGPGEGYRGLCVEGCLGGFGPVLGAAPREGARGCPGWEGQRCSV